MNEEEKKVKVRILPGHGIGGVGGAGDEVWVSAAEAEMYVRDGYVELVENSVSDPSPSPSPTSGEGGEQPAIMKPQVKRVRKK